MSFKVLIIGAGTGGLCLAHGLQSRGIDAQVFERDQNAVDRQQGYRLNISATGNRALKTCLPEENYARFVASSAVPSTAVTFFDHHLHRLLGIDIPPVDRDSLDAERPVSRIALRRLLLDGVESRVIFGKTFVSYESAADGRVLARFADESVAAGDLLVGADGANSRVARQLLPESARIDTGVTVVAGRFSLDEQARRETPPEILRGPTLVMGPPGCFMFASAVQYPSEAVTSDREEYVMWGVSTTARHMGRNGHAAHLDQDSARELARRLVSTWHPALQRLVERVEPESLSSFPVKSAKPIGPWKSGKVTLLGDALHNMTPFRGMGANAALKDAAELVEALSGVARGERELLAALTSYEAEMIRSGFAAVQGSLGDMQRLHSESRVGRFAAKTFFRTVDRMPRSVQTMFRGRR